jgi:hypothetical protein
MSREENEPHTAPSQTPSRGDSEFAEDRVLGADASRRPVQSGDKGSTVAKNVEAPHQPTNIHDLSFILHPSHETSSPDQDRTSHTGGLPVDGQEANFIQDACSVLGVTQAVMEQM